MTALADNRDARQGSRDVHTVTVATGVHVYKGAFVGISPADGLAYPMGGSATPSTLRCIGVARQELIGDGTSQIEVYEGVFMAVNSSSADQLAEGDVSSLVYAVDDQTAAKTSNSGARAPLGILKSILDDGSCRVSVGVVESAPAQQDDRSIELRVDTLVGTNVYRVVCPYAGLITKIWSVIDGALTTGDATLTAKIGTTAITSGVITITQAGSAAGDVDSATPSAANVCAAGDVLSVTVGGTNATASVAKVTFEIHPL